MKKIIKKFSELTLSKKIQLITALILTTGLLVAIPVYAWFNRQKKAAEMFKVEYPNSLYINAAHREDKCYLKLDAININGYAKDSITGEVLTENGEKVKVTKYQYVFSVSGSSTSVFTLQMAHTNNNLFKYTLYEAENYASCVESTDNGETNYTLSGNDINDTSKTTTISETDKDRIVKYKHKADTHNENQLQVIGDNYVNDVESDIYYVKSDSAISGENTGYQNEDTTHSFSSYSPTNYFARTTDNYYTKTYGDNTNVEIHSVPLYWQGDINVITDNNKNFCKYFVLEVTWNDAEQATQTEKETDMIYFSVKRVS